MKEFKKQKVSITLDPSTIKMLDIITSNRSNLINHLLKEYFNKNNENITKIKL